eukprot:scaffold52029_cov39-Tisochrysis_lutea.AAC.2
MWGLKIALNESNARDPIGLRWKAIVQRAACKSPLVGIQTGYPCGHILMGDATLPRQGCKLAIHASI